MQAADVAKALAALREQVIELARGDNVISVWVFEMDEKQPAPRWLIDTYEARVLNWIFGDPFEESADGLHCRSVVRALRDVRDAGLTGNEALKEELMRRRKPTL